MKRIVVVLLGIASLAYGAEKNETSAARRFSVHVVGGLVTASGSYGGLALLGVEFPTREGSPLRIGLESGTLFGSGQGIPVLASFVLRSDEIARGVSPFLGISAGPVFSSGAGVFGTGDSVKLGIFLRAGARYPLGHAFDAMPELWIGGLTGVFVMAPVLKLAVYL